MSLRDDPVKDRSFQTFRVVGSCTRHPFLNLLESMNTNISQLSRSYKFSSCYNVITRPFHEALFQTRNHLQELPKNAMLSSLPVGKRSEGRNEVRDNEHAQR